MAYPWYVAQKLKYYDICAYDTNNTNNNSNSDESVVNNIIFDELRMLESSNRTNEGYYNFRLQDQIKNDINIINTEKIKSIARVLWNRRVGVLIHSNNH